MKLTLRILKDSFGICRFDKNAEIPKWAYGGEFYSITRTKDELSVVCPEKNIQKADKVSRGWKAFKIEGPLDFSLIGIMANLSTTLANGGVTIFAVSTYDTDYIFVKEENLEKASSLLQKAGHQIIKE